MNYWFFLACLFANISSFSQTRSDSLVRLSDIHYHSEFEKEAIKNFVHYTTDTFNLFLAIDEGMSYDEASEYYQAYKEIFQMLQKKKIESKKINKKIKIAYSSVHAHYLKKYVETDYYPALFQNGNYNCVTASMLYALVYSKISVPYKVMASSNHVYLVANPGPNSTVIETTNPGFERTIFTGEFKQQYVSYLKESKLIGEEEFRNKSTEEIFEAKFKEVHETTFNNLPGFQYYNKAVHKAEDNKTLEAYELCQKAYLFYPNNQVKTLLHSLLLYQIEKCRFTTVSDIDYLAQLSRFQNADINLIQEIFSNIIAHHLQFIDKEEYCDSLFKRLISKIDDNHMVDEISFSYFIQMAYYQSNSPKAEYFANNALKIKNNHRDANRILVSCLHRKLSKIDEPQVLLDSIIQIESRYTYDFTVEVLKNYRLVSYLRLARDYYRDSKPQSGDSYLLKFEESCDLPISNEFLLSQVDASYSTAAAYYFNHYNRTKARGMLRRGLTFAPDSHILRSLRY